MIKLLMAVLLFSLGFVAGKFVRVPAARAGADKYTLQTCVSQFDKNRASTGSRGWAFWFVRKDLSGGLNVKMSQVAPRQAKHAPHAHDEAEAFYILKGKAELILAGESMVVGPNSTLYCPPGVPHGIRNAGEDSLRYLVIKSN